MEKKSLVCLDKEKESLFNKFIKENNILVADGTEIELITIEGRRKHLLKQRLSNKLMERMVYYSVRCKDLWKKRLSVIMIYDCESKYHLKALNYVCEGKMLDFIDLKEEKKYYNIKKDELPFDNSGLNIARSLNNYNKMASRSFFI